MSEFQTQHEVLQDTSETLNDHAKVTTLSVRGGIVCFITLYVVVSAHHTIILGNFISAAIAPYLLFKHLEPPLALALGFLVITPLLQISLSKTMDCPMTRLENHLRWRLRKPKIRGFIGHYYVKPVRRFFKRPKMSVNQTPEL